MRKAYYFNDVTKEIISSNKIDCNKGYFFGIFDGEYEEVIEQIKEIPRCLSFLKEHAPEQLI